MSSLPLFYYPSTISWVDDDALFLKAASQFFNEHSATQTFNCPNKCLNFFKSYQIPFSNLPLLHACVDHEYYETAHHAPVDFNVTALQTVHDETSRKQEISVMIVDYGMSAMNGIELCRQLRNYPIKKILLTGEADSNDAVTAFNDNTIDRFLRKDSKTLVADLQNYIATLTQQYFRDRTAPLLSHLEAGYRLPLSDPIFIEFFQTWCNKNDIKEYSLIDKNGSFIVINRKDERFYFVVHTDRSLDAFVRLNEDIEDAEKFLREVRGRKRMPFFGVGKNSWEFEEKGWERFFYGMEVVVGREKYYWTVIKK